MIHTHESKEHLNKIITTIYIKLNANQMMYVHVIIKRRIHIHEVKEPTNMTKTTMLIHFYICKLSIMLIQNNVDTLLYMLDANYLLCLMQNRELFMKCI